MSNSNIKIKEIAEIGELDLEKYPMQKELKVSEWSKMKLLFHPDRKRIIAECSSPEGVSIKILSEKLELNPGSIHNHIKKLHAAGFIRIIKRSYIKGIEEKRYQLTAKFINIREINPKEKKLRNAFLGKDIQKEIVSILNSDVKDDCFLKTADVYLSPENYAIARQKLDDLIEFLSNSHNTGGQLYSFVLAAGENNVK